MERKISVVVVTYNHEQTIARTLDSILMQQCSWAVEIVIGEDCSTDNTRAICRQYQQQHPDKIRLFCHSENKGVIDNYFDCLLECKGKYIADCAGDDFWVDPLKLEKEKNILEAHPEVTLVHTAWNYYDEVAKIARQPAIGLLRQPFTEGRQLLADIITQTDFPVIHLCTSLYRKDVFLQAYSEDTFMFRNREFGCEDLAIAAAMAVSGHIAYLPDITLNYSVNHPSVSFCPDDARQFLFVRRTTDLSYYLSQKYHLVNAPKLNTFFRQRAFTLAMHAFRSHSEALRDEAKRWIEKWGVAPTWRVAVVQSIMKSKGCWNCALALRKLIVGLKHIGR